MGTVSTSISKILFVLTMVTFYISGFCSAKEIHVPLDFSSIQQAIDYAEDGDTVCVKPGTYFENINFIGKEITLEGIRGPDYTVLDGMQSGSVITFDSGENIRTVLKGFTIWNGTGTAHYPDSPENLYGGGIYCFDSSPLIIDNNIKNNQVSRRGGGISCIGIKCKALISDCIISDNKSQSMGGGIFCQDADITVNKCKLINNASEADCGGGLGAFLHSDPTIKNTLLSLNSAQNVGGAVFATATAKPIITNNIITNNNARVGGGIAVQGGIISNNVIKYNTASSGSKSLNGHGGGIYCSGKNTIVTNNVISFNTAISNGGGIRCGGSDVLVSNNIISYNVASGSDDKSVKGEGGGIAIYPGSAILKNCLIYKNCAKDSGGGIYIQEVPAEPSKPIILNCTIVNNNSDGGSGIYSYSYHNYEARNTIIHNEGGEELYYVERKPNITYCNIKGGFVGKGNIDEDPLFVDAINDDYHLQFTSPSRDAGDPSGQGLPEFDFEGDPRLSGKRADMGADEFHAHLYITGDTTPGGTIQLKLLGLPGPTPIGLFLGADALDVPLPSSLGDWYLDFPFHMVQIWTFIPRDGLVEMHKQLPTVPLGQYYLQAVIGDALSNLCVIEVE